MPIGTEAILLLTPSNSESLILQIAIWFGCRSVPYLVNNVAEVGLVYNADPHATTSISISLNRFSRN